MINNDTKEIDQALEIGYRLIDTAISYRNESVVGISLSNTDISRNDIFVTTKIPGTLEYRTKSLINEAIDNSLDALKTNYIDLLLIHHPWDNLDEMVIVWQVLEENVLNGRVKSIGLSNFNIEQTSYILKHAKIKPVVNQIESHPGYWQHELISFLQDNDIVPQAWGPISRVSDSSKEVLTNIGNNYNKSWVQVILNYQISRNVIVIPKSHRYEGQRENIEIFDFTLTKEEENIISKL